VGVKFSMIVLYLILHTIEWASI